jgi:hypothetical protein
LRAIASRIKQDNARGSWRINNSTPAWSTYARRNLGELEMLTEMQDVKERPCSGAVTSDLLHLTGFPPQRSVAAREVHVSTTVPISTAPEGAALAAVVSMSPEFALDGSGE